MTMILSYLMAILLVALLMLPPYIAGKVTMKDQIKSSKLIIIDTSSYRCKMVKTLEED